MRALWTAGEALNVSNIAGYNCAYLTFEKPRDFAEHLYILMNGTGSGYSVERQFINKLPRIPETLSEVDETIVFEDSKLGWAEGIEKYFDSLYAGKIPKYDLSKIRAKGTILKTFGGRASGPEPLRELLEFTKETFIQARGKKLSSIEVNDIACFIANIVVSGGVRRSACISLSNLSDRRMANAKSGEFWKTHMHRSMANNSTAYTELPDIDIFMEEWLTLMRSGSGERGIFNREAAQIQARKFGRRNADKDFGTNPCGEIILRPKQFCNLTEVVVRPEDHLGDLLKKIESAVILGAVQSTLDEYPFLSDEWRKNAEEERLLGVSLTGLRDHPTLQSTSIVAETWLTEMRKAAVSTAKRWSKILKINMATAVTCVKPSGTVSQLVGCSSGLHPAYSKYYIRRIRVAATDPVCTLLMQSGIPYNPEVGQAMESASTYVFDFPMKSAGNSIIADEVNALEQLNYWLMIKENWTEHNPSCTIYVREHEWLAVGSWVYENWDKVTGITFLPLNNHVYQLAPYEKISEDKYNELIAKMPEINFGKLTDLEKEDYTTGAKQYACVGGACEI
jgi:ribonucleoside-diphosphate reductase alpha chain